MELPQDPEPTLWEQEVWEQEQELNAPEPETDTPLEPLTEKYGFPFDQTIKQYKDGEISASKLVSELEFDGFDGDITDIL
jgi:hypothetical protein